MPGWAGWISFILALAFGALNIYQFFDYKVSKARGNLAESNVIAARTSLQQLRGMCTEAIDTGEVIDTKAARQFVRQTAYTLLSIENILTATLRERS